MCSLGNNCTEWLIVKSFGIFVTFEMTNKHNNMVGMVFRICIRRGFGPNAKKNNFISLPEIMFGGVESLERAWLQRFLDAISPKR